MWGAHEFPSFLIDQILKLFNRYLLVRSFGLGIPGTRNVYIGMGVENTGNKNVNITSSLNSEPKITHYTYWPREINF